MRVLLYSGGGEHKTGKTPKSCGLWVFCCDFSISCKWSKIASLSSSLQGHALPAALQPCDSLCWQIPSGWALYNSDSHPHHRGIAQCQITPEEEQYQPLLCQLQSRSVSVTSLSHVQPMPPSPSSSTPVIAGLRNVELHLRKSSINPSSSGFNPTPSCLPRSTYMNLVSALHDAKTPSHPLVLLLCWLPLTVLPSHCLIATAGCHVSSWHLLVAPPSCCLVTPAVCCIDSCCPLVVQPSQPLITPAGCCITSCCITLSSSHSAALLASHGAGWVLSCSHRDALSSTHCSGWLLHRLYCRSSFSSSLPLLQQRWACVRSPCQCAIFPMLTSRNLALKCTCTLVVEVEPPLLLLPPCVEAKVK